MIRLIVFSLVLFGLLACTPSPRKPKFVPEEEEMAILLADIYEVEAAISQNGQQIDRNDTRFVGYYKSVLDKHELTKLEFDSAVSWYSAHPLIFAEVYDDVISILSRRDAQLKQSMSVEKEESPEHMAIIPDVKDYWKERRTYELPLNDKDSLEASLPFQVLMDSISVGILRLHASYTFVKGNELDSAQMFMIACFADSTRDTLEHNIHKSFEKTSANLSLSIPKGKKLISLEGLLFEHDTSRVTKVKVEDVKLTFVPKIVPRTLR